MPNEKEYSFGESSLAHLGSADPRMQEIMSEAIKTSPYDFGIVQGKRTQDQQWGIYKQGRELIPGGDPMNPAQYKSTGKTVTGYATSVEKLMGSRHIPVEGSSTALAVDIAYYNPETKGYDWSDESKYKELGAHIKSVAGRLGYGKDFQWGGEWKRQDLPHYQVSTSRPSGTDVAMDVMKEKPLF